LAAEHPLVAQFHLEIQHQQHKVHQE